MAANPEGLGPGLEASDPLPLFNLNQVNLNQTEVANQLPVPPGPADASMPATPLNAPCTIFCISESTPAQPAAVPPWGAPPPWAAPAPAPWTPPWAVPAPEAAPEAPLGPAPGPAPAAGPAAAPAAEVPAPQPAGLLPAPPAGVFGPAPAPAPVPSPEVPAPVGPLPGPVA